MKKALVSAFALVLGIVGPAPSGDASALLRGQKRADTIKCSPKTKRTTAEKRAMYIYPKVIKALDNPTRREILAFLLENEGEQIPFTRLKQQVPGLKNASLSRHLNILQRAWLIERRVELGSPRTAEDRYYSFYSISKFGEQMLKAFSRAFMQSNP